MSNDLPDREENGADKFTSRREVLKALAATGIKALSHAIIPRAWMAPVMGVIALDGDFFYIGGSKISLNMLVATPWSVGGGGQAAADSPALLRLDQSTGELTPAEQGDISSNGTSYLTNATISFSSTKFVNATTTQLACYDTYAPTMWRTFSNLTSWGLANVTQTYMGGRYQGQFNVTLGVSTTASPNMTSQLRLPSQPVNGTFLCSPNCTRNIPW